MKFKKKRLKTSHGITASFGYGQNKEGKWRVTSCGSLKMGRHNLPTAFAPFELSDAVMNPFKVFDTEEQVLDFIRRI